jgi:hypothetical protein
VVVVKGDARHPGRIRVDIEVLADADIEVDVAAVPGAGWSPCSAVPAEVAGLQTGDVVQAWRQGSANGDVASPFQLARVEQELAPHGPVILTVARNGARLDLEVTTGRWALSTHPRLETQVGRLPDDTTSPPAPEEDWEALSRSAMDAGRPLDSAWFDIRTAVELARSGMVEDADAILNSGASKIAESRLLPFYWERACDALLVAGQTGIAARAIDRAVGILDDESPESPALAHALLQRCRADFRSCNDRASRALEIYSRINATTIEVAEALTSVGIVAYYRSELDPAEIAYHRALNVTRITMPGSPTELNLLGNLGLVAMRRGDFASAGQLFRKERDKAIQLGGSNTCLGFASSSCFSRRCGKPSAPRIVS